MGEGDGVREGVALEEGEGEGVMEGVSEPDKVGEPESVPVEEEE